MGAPKADKDARVWKVYVHINKTNGKRYVGITSKKDPNARWQSGRGYMHNLHLWSSIQKYGWDGFDHIVLFDNLTCEEANAKEVELIAEWDTKNKNFGYNQTDGGGGARGCFVSEKTRALLSERFKKENLSEETLRRRSESLRGRKFTEEHKRKIGDGNSKPINMFSLTGEFIRTFSSAREAEVELGISHSHISQCCHGHRATTGGYTWSFA